MKKGKKYITGILILSMLFSNTIIATEISGAELVKSKIKQVEENQPVLQESAQLKKSRNEFDNLMNAIKEGEQYPDYYGGAYMTDDEDLVVLVTDKTPEFISSIEKSTKSSDVRIECVEVSLNYLHELQKSHGNCYVELYKEKETMKTFAIEDAELLEDLRGSYIDEKNNELVVKIENISDSKIQSYKKLFGDQKHIRYIEGGKIVQTADWKAGRKIYTSTSELSTGYRAYYIDSNGTRYNGFVTAGHTCSVNSLIYRLSSRMPINILGQCKVRQISGKVDAAFISIEDANYTASNSLYYPTDVSRALEASTYATSVSQDDWIYKAGATTFSTLGRVISSSGYHYGSGGLITDLYETNVLTLPGDSGGVAYIFRNNKYLTIGIMTASQFSSSSEFTEDTFEYSYITKIGNTISALGIRKY